MPRLTVAFDYICPWCYAGWHQALRLKQEFPTLELEWKGFELLPEGMEYHPEPPDPNPVKKPRTPSRLELLFAADGLVMPKRKRAFSRSRRAMEGAEFATEAGKGDAYHDAIYRVYWEENANIGDVKVLAEIAKQIGLDVDQFLAALGDRRYRDRIVEFDEPAHKVGIWHVPTWMFPEEWVAEQPYSVVREMAERFVKQDVH